MSYPLAGAELVSRLFLRPVLRQRSVAATPCAPRTESDPAACLGYWLSPPGPAPAQSLSAQSKKRGQTPVTKAG